MLPRILSLAARLSWAQLTFAGKVKVDPAAASVEIERVTEFGNQVMNAKFPAVLSVVEKINEPRYPSFKGIMAAKKKTIESRDLAAVGVSAASAWSEVKDSAPRPARSACRPPGRPASPSGIQAGAHARPVLLPALRPGPRARRRRRPLPARPSPGRSRGGNY